MKLTLSFCDDGVAPVWCEGTVLAGGSEYLQLLISTEHWTISPHHSITNPFCLGRCSTCPYCSSLPPCPLEWIGCGLACSPYPLFSNRRAWFCCWYAGGSEWRAWGGLEARMGVLVLVGRVLSRSSRVSSNWWWWWGSMARDRACCSREASTWGHASGMGWGRWISTCKVFIRLHFYQGWSAKFVF